MRLEQANVELPGSPAQNVCDFERPRLTKLARNTHLLNDRSPHLPWLDCLKRPADNLSRTAKQHLARGLINLLDHPFAIKDQNRRF